MISLRIAVASDHEMLAELGRKSFFEAFGTNSGPEDMKNYLDASFHPEKIRNQLLDETITFIIADYDGQPVAYSKLKRNSTFETLNNSNTVQLERIYVLQKDIGKKIGAALMAESIRLSKSDGFEYIWLGVWQENKRAVEFYKKWGFVVIGFKQFIIGSEVNDDYVMALKLKAQAPD